MLNKQKMSQENDKEVIIIDLCDNVDLMNLDVGMIKIKEILVKSTKPTNVVSKNEFRLRQPNAYLNSQQLISTETEKCSSNYSYQVNTSTKEFLQKEKMCNEMNKSEADKKDDTLCDLASVAFDKYSSDFENATEQDIESMLEEMSKIAGALSPNSGTNHATNNNLNKNTTDEERSVEEILEEAVKIVQKSSCNLNKNSNESTILISDDLDNTTSAIQRVNELEANIFHLIEQEVHKESEKLRNSPRSEKGRNSIEILYENVANFRPTSSLQMQKKKFEEQKIDVSSNSDLDDPIERHSKSEDIKNDEKKDNLRKEITDVDENFFPDLSKRSIEKNEGGLSGSSSFEQEDFFNLLKLLQGEGSEKADFLDGNIRLKKDYISSGYPEKEIAEVLENSILGGAKEVFNINKVPKVVKNEEPIRIVKEDKFVDAKKIVNSNNELYTVDLTPRLELFADAIPKLIAEKTVEQEEKAKNILQGTMSNDDLVLVSKKCEVAPRMKSAPEFSKKKKAPNIEKSKSCDQLTKNNDKNPQCETEKKKSGFQIHPPLFPKMTGKSKILPKSKTLPNSKKELSKYNFMSSLTKNQPKTNNKAIVNSKKSLEKSEWEILYNEEKHKNKLLKEQIEAEARRYKAQMESMRVSFEQELFLLKKQNIILKAKTDERTLIEKRSDNSKVALLEEELERQEKLIKAYEAENKKLLQDTKLYQMEMKNLRQKQKNSVNVSEIQKLQDQIKDLKEETLKLNLEVTELRQKNSDCTLKNEDLMQQNSLLHDELDMFKEQLSIKNNFITTRLQAMTTAELNLKKQMEDLKVELSSKTEQLKLIKLDYDKLQHGVLPIEKELMELRVKETTLTEKLQVAKSHVEREKQLTLKLKDQVILDNKKILDLTRQIKEMERIIKRKNPDSMAALLLSTSSEQEKAHAEKVRQYEDKITRLENDLKNQEEGARKQITDLQRRLDEINEKHAVRVSELEQRIMDLNFSNDRKICTEACTQTLMSHLEGKKNEEKNIKTGQKSQSMKEDTHLLATIRGLKLEVSNKDKTITKLTKDLQEIQKTNRRLQREREKLLNERRNVTRSSSMHRMTDVNDQNSNVYHNGHVSGHRLSSSMHKLYDPLQFSENNIVNGESSKRLSCENEALKEELLKVNKELITLKNKRIHDLNMLQEEHEHELAEMVKGYTAKLGDSKSQLNNQMAVINHLRDQLRKMQDFKDQAIVLKAERDHLETKVKMLSQKVKYLSTSDNDQLQQLQDKIALLQQRHESREMTLQNLVRQLMRNRAQCRDCRSDKDKSSQLCYFRQELDQILSMLQEIAKSC